MKDNLTKEQEKEFIESEKKKYKTFKDDLGLSQSRCMKVADLAFEIIQYNSRSRVSTIIKELHEAFSHYKFTDKEMIYGGFEAGTLMMERLMNLQMRLMEEMDDGYLDPKQ